MSKLLRVPLTLLAVLAAMLFLPGIAWADLPDCTATPTPAGCTAPGTGTTGGGTSATTTGGTAADQPATDPATNPATKPAAGGTTGQQQTGQPTAQQPQPQPQSLAVVPLQPPSNAAPAVPLLDVPTTPPNFCDQLPTLPICTGSNPPTGPLTCDQLATLLHLPGGCPQNFSCADLASLLGLTCPAGPPDCAALAALFHLQGCPQPPTSCQEFADLLGVDHCSQIPCLDTSKLPQQARDGLGPLFDGLKNIGIKQCPAAPKTSGGTTPPGQGTQTQNPPPAQQPQPPAATTQQVAAPATTTAQPTGKLAYTGMELGPQLDVAWTLLVLGTGLLIAGRRRA